MQPIGKQPYEVFPISLDFSDSMSSGETISSFTVFAYDSASTDVTSTIISASSNTDQVVTVTLQGGTSGSSYKIEVKIVTTSAKNLEEEITLNVFEDYNEDRLVISLSEMKDFMKFDLDDEDDLITSLIQGAERVAERYTGLTFLNKTITEYFNSWESKLIVSDKPVRSVTAIYVATDADYTEEEVTSSYYKLFNFDDMSKDPFILLKQGYTLPTIYPDTLGVRAVYVAGFGETPQSVPSSIKLAIKLIVSHWFENRESQEIPNEAQRILQKYKVYRI